MNTTNSSGADDAPLAKGEGTWRCTRRRLLAALGLEAAVGRLVAAPDAVTARKIPRAMTPNAPKEPEMPGRPVVPGRAVLFPLSAIRLLDGPMRDGQEMNRRYLLTLEPDRLLSWFRREAGLDPKAPPYRGWESETPHLPGHILGFYLSGASMTVQATGDPELRRRLDGIVDELERIQDANGNGYLLAVAGGKRVFTEVARGNIEIDGLPWTGFQINGIFEPTYTLNKLMLGLYQVILATGNPKAHRVLVRLADWFGEAVLDHLTEEQTQKLLDCEHGSLHESFADVFRLTGDRRYLTWARRLCHERMLTPLAAGDGNFLTGYHANTQIPKYTGFAAVWALTGEDILDRAALNFWNEVVDRRTWVIGGNSAAEHFFDPGDFTRALGEAAGPETCNTVNMLRLTEALYCAHPSGRLMDYYERALFNHILAVHDPERGMFVYYTALRPGAYRVYSDPYDSMWCCVGTGLEVPGKYGQMIYSRAPDHSALDVHLFIASELHWTERGVTVRQDTRFPDEPSTRLTFRCEDSVTFALRIRHPEWVEDGGLRVTLNGGPIAGTSKRGEYAEIRRTWKSGDTVHVALPMQTVLDPLPGNDRYVALRHGPIVLAGALGRLGLAKGDFWQIGDMVARKPMAESRVPAFVVASPADVRAQVQPRPGRGLAFRAHGLLRPEELGPGQSAPEPSGAGGPMEERAEPVDVEMIPFHRCHFQRYAVYWRVFTPEELQAERARLAEDARQRQADQEIRRQAQAALEARTVDRVRIGDPVSEEAHGLRGEGTFTGRGAYGERMETRWRDARDGGWFSFEMTVPSSQAATLRCTFWGQERGARTFEITADGHTLSTVILGDTGKAEFVDLDLPLGQDLKRGRETLTIAFRARPGNTAGGLFDLRVLSEVHATSR